MKLLTVQDGITIIEQRIGIPATHELTTGGIYRNSSPQEQPFYKIELEWNRIGEPELDEEGLVNRHTIRAELDALTGRLAAYYRHDRRSEEREQRTELHSELYNAVYPHVIEWIDKLQLPIAPEELQLRKKQAIGKNRYKLEYARQHAGISFAAHQAFHIELSSRFELLHLFCVWDECSFTDPRQAKPAQQFRQMIGENQLSLCYLTLFHPSSHPHYMYREDIFDAETGQILYSDKAEVTELIRLDRPEPEYNQLIQIHRKPVFSAAHYDVLKLDDAVTEADLTAPHPFAPLLENSEIAAARQLAVSYLKQCYAHEPCQFAFLRKDGHHPIEGMQGGQIKVEIHRLRHGIPIIGGKLNLFLDRQTREMTNVMDALKLFQSGKERIDTAGLLPPRITAAEAWEQLRGCFQLSLQYMLKASDCLTGPKRAVLAYKLVDHDEVCDAVTGMPLKLAPEQN